MAIIGIDLGTTNSLVSIYRNGRAELLPNEWGQLLTPSCVGVLEDGTVTVGAVQRSGLSPIPGKPRPLSRHGWYPKGIFAGRKDLSSP